MSVRKAGRPDLILFVLALVLVAIGLVFVYSASYPKATRLDPQHPARYFTRQATFAGVGLIALLTLARIPLQTWHSRWMPPLLLGFAFALVVLSFFPPIGTSLGRQAWRWIHLGPLTIQPSEIAKLAVVLYLASFLAEKNPDQLASFKRGLLPALIVVGLMLTPILLQPHLGAVLVIGGTALILLFVGGADPRQLAGVVIFGAVLVSVSIWTSPYRKSRLEAWLNPLSDPQGQGYHAIHHGTALARGGISGRHFTQSVEKFLYLPECFTDSILAVIGEEMGFMGTLTLLLLHFGLAYRGFDAAIHCSDPFAQLLGVGLSSLILIQTLLNYAAVTNVLPQTGMGLPFISYGGTSLLSYMAAVGLLLNISIHAAPRRADLDEPETVRSTPHRRPH